MIFSAPAPTPEEFSKKSPAVHRFGFFNLRKVKCSACNHDKTRMITTGSMFKIYEHHRCEACGNVDSYVASEY